MSKEASAKEDVASGERSRQHVDSQARHPTANQFLFQQVHRVKYYKKVVAGDHPASKLRAEGQRCKKGTMA